MAGAVFREGFLFPRRIVALALAGLVVLLIEPAWNSAVAISVFAAFALVRSGDFHSALT